MAQPTNWDDHDFEEMAEFDAECPGDFFTNMKLAKRYWIRCEFSVAEKFYRNALQIREKEFGVNHPALAAPLCGLARIYSTMDENQRVEELLMHALSILEGTLQFDGPTEADIRAELAGFHSCQGNEQTAENFSTDLHWRREYTGRIMAG